MSFASALFAVSRSYFIILFSACQELFLKSFFKIFSNLLHNFSVLSRFGLPLSCSDFFYYTQLFEFVKNFFQLFFKFVSFHFYVLNLFSFKPAVLRRLVLLYTFLPFCQHLFWKNFQLFLKIRQKPWKSAIFGICLNDGFSLNYLFILFCCTVLMSFWKKIFHFLLMCLCCIPLQTLFCYYIFLCFFRLFCRFSYRFFFPL